MTEPLPMCPMAATCEGMMGRPRSGVALLIPGMVLILLGVIVLFEPRILVWLVAATFILMGLTILVFGRFMRRFGGRS